MKIDKHSIRSLALHWLDQGLGIVVATLFWFIIVVIALVASAQSEKRWDTVIAALAMGSQAFFAAAVWKLGKNQFAFTQKVSERQHNIEMYPLRKTAAADLSEAAKALLYGRFALSDDSVEAFRLCHLEIKNLFSDEAEELAYELYEMADKANLLHTDSRPVYNIDGAMVRGVDDDKVALYEKCYDQAQDILIELINKLDDEMRIQ